MGENKPLNLADEIFQDLRRQILSGSLPAGRRLPPERELSTAYKTNRNTLREAIRKLEHERLVVVRHGQGVTVSDFRRSATIGMLGPFFDHTPDLREKGRVLLDLLPVRSHLLELATRMAAERATAEDIQRLDTIAAQIARAGAAGDAAASMAGYVSWLEALVDAAHSVPIRWAANPFLDAERDVVQRLPSAGALDPALPPMLLAFVAGLRGGNATVAREAMQRLLAHVDEGLSRMLTRSYCDGEIPDNLAPPPPSSRMRIHNPPVLQPATDRKRTRSTPPAPAPAAVGADSDT